LLITDTIDIRAAQPELKILQMKEKSVEIGNILYRQCKL